MQRDKHNQQRLSAFWLHFYNIYIMFITRRRLLCRLHFSLAWILPFTLIWAFVLNSVIASRAPVSTHFPHCFLHTDPDYRDMNESEASQLISVSPLLPSWFFCIFMSLFLTVSANKIVLVISPLMVKKRGKKQNKRERSRSVGKMLPCTTRWCVSVMHIFVCLSTSWKKVNVL